VTGRSGQLGASLEKLSVDYPHFSSCFLSRAELDFEDLGNIPTFLQAHDFDVLVNTAAYTAVDQAELEPSLCDQINHQAVKALAQGVAQVGAKMIHISSDYVFGGDAVRPYTEEDRSAPLGVYGQTKRDGEKAVFEALPTGGMVLRSSWLYSEFGENFVKRILELSGKQKQIDVVADQRGAPTYAEDLARCIFQVIDHPKFQTKGQKTELFHYSNEGACSWYEFAKEICLIAEISCEVRPVTSSQRPSSTKRPNYSVLDSRKIKAAYGALTPAWRVSLAQCLENLGMRK